MRYVVGLTLLLTLTYANVHNDLQSILSLLHDDAAYQALSPELQQLTVDIASFAKTGQLTGCIDKIGFSSVLNLINHLPVDAAHNLEDYMLEVLTHESMITLQQAQMATAFTSTETPHTNIRSKRSKPANYLAGLESSHAYHSLPDEYKGVLRSILAAAQSNTLSQYIRKDVNIIPKLLHHMNPGYGPADSYCQTI
ncbi:uncharacterized protein [Argopecten irradians]|uniref:uncharacterized protein n=1 Tax=Argopecten irradians TaxID=31199 RepID=UPI00371D09D4